MRTVRSERTAWNFASSASSSGRIGRMVTFVLSFAVHVPTYWIGYGRIASLGSCSSCVSLSKSTTRASSASNFSGDAISGLISSSLTQCCSVMSCEKRTSRRSRAARSTGSRPRHHTPCERRRERRQPEGAVFEDLHQLTAQPEQQHRSELRVDAAAQDQLVSLDLCHRLDGDAKEVPGSHLFRDRSL